LPDTADFINATLTELISVNPGV